MYEFSKKIKGETLFESDVINLKNLLKSRYDFNKFLFEDKIIKLKY